MFCKPLGGVGSLPVIFQSRTFLRFIRRSGHQELNPVFDPVFGKDEHDQIKGCAFNPLLLSLPPELVSQGIAVVHVMVQVGPNHERGVAARSKNLL